MWNQHQRMAGTLMVMALLSAAIPCAGQDAAARGPGEPRKTNALAVLQEKVGRVELAVPAPHYWIEISRGQELHAGDVLRTGTNSHAVLSFSDQETIHMGPSSETRIAPPPGRARGFDALRGLFYFFHRDKPEDFGTGTPRGGMIVRGTEVVLEVAADGTTRVSVIEGAVDLDNQFGRKTFVTGEAGLLEAGQPPHLTAMLPVASLIQWCLYYPAVINPRELRLDAATTTTLRDSLAAYAQGDLPGALAAYPATRQPGSDGEQVYRAALWLSVGRVHEAESLLDRVSSTEAAEPAAALRRLMATVRAPAARAAVHLDLAADRTAGTPLLLADSYTAQSRGDIERARQLARRAADRSPEFGFAWARVAELEFSSGRIPAARKAVERSLQLTPRNAQAVTLQGFLLAAQDRTTEATAQFERAMALDGGLANAWLGRGLCRIRRGDAAGGRNDLQVAVTLEPNRAVLRSYLGKAFEEAGNIPRAIRELDLARQWDPNDPTPWLYSALLNQQENRVNDGIRDLERSVEINDHRQVYRSALLLEQDAAVRGANLATVYADAGLADAARWEAVRAVNLDYANPSAHRFLANSYAALNDLNQRDARYETAQANEYLISTLLAPVGAGPLSPFVSAQEYGRLFDRDGFRVASSTEYLSRGAWAQSAAQYGRFGNMAYSLDALYRSDPGQRPNNDLELLSLSAQVKLQLTPQDSIYAQAIGSRVNAGDLNRYYNPAEANPAVRVRETQEPIVLAGYHREWSPGQHSLLLFGGVRDTLEVANPEQGAIILGRTNRANAPVSRVVPFALDADYRGGFDLYSLEGQQIVEAARNTFIAGARVQVGRFDSRSQSTAPTFVSSNVNRGTVLYRADDFDNPPQRIQSDFFRWNIYGYWQREVVESLRLIAGVSYDRIEYPVNHRFGPISREEDSTDQVSPKAGLIWTPHQRLTLRAGYSQSLGGVSFDQSFQLEPSQIAGFNQAWRSLIPESVAGGGVVPRFENWGIALDSQLGRGTYVGLSGQWLRSEMDRTIGAYAQYPPTNAGPLAPPEPSIFQSSTRQSFDYDERTIAASVHQLVGRDWSFGARYSLSHAHLESAFPEVPAAAALFTSFQNGRELTFQNGQDVTSLLHQINLVALYTHPCGLFGQLDAAWWQQHNTGYWPDRPGDDFWQFNVFVGYRFPHRQAEVRLGVLNLTDRDYQINPLNFISEPPRERTLYASFRFSF